jgi:hypothetical protein
MLSCCWINNLADLQHRGWRVLLLPLLTLLLVLHVCIDMLR